MKNAIRTAAAVITAALAAVAAPSAHAANSAPSSQALLFSTISDAATVSVSAYSTSITLPGASPTTWFTDRPQRKAGMTTLEQVASRWASFGFEKSAPNAAIVLHQGSVAKQVVVSLSRPRVEGSLVTFTTTPLPRARVLGMSTTGTLAAGNFGPTEIFIDAADPSTTSTRTYSGDCYTVTVVTTSTDGNGNTTQSSSIEKLSGISDEFKVCKHLHLGGTTVSA